MSVIDNISISRSLSKIDLMVGTNKRKQPCLYVCDINCKNKVLLKQFFNHHQYRRWICEAALLYAMLGDTYKPQIKKTFKAFENFLADKEKEIEKF